MSLKNGCFKKYIITRNIFENIKKMMKEEQRKSIIHCKDLNRKQK